MADHETAIDQKYLDKQSRTIGTYGLETMTKLISFKVLIVGCGGVGIEIAKNLALAGIHSITLYDQRRPTVADMGVNFAVTDAVIKAGVTVAEASRAYIAELNPNTRVKTTTELTEAVVGAQTAVIFTAAAPDLSIKTLNRWNVFCHNHKPVVSFLLALQVGAVGSVFVDHGAHFTVKDLDGRPMLQKTITEISAKTDKTGDAYSRIRFETPEGQTPGALRDYTRIKLSEVQGLTKPDGSSVNGQTFDGVVCPGDPRDTVRVYPSFEAQGYTAEPYQTGGFIHELKETVTLSFRTLQETLPAPGQFIPVSPMMDGSEESQVHIYIDALLRFADSHNGFLPALHNPAEANEMVKIAKQVVEENKKLPKPAHPEHVSAKPAKEEFPARSAAAPPPEPLIIDELNEASIQTEALVAAAELQPLASFFGAVVAQEIVKISGKYTPIHQWFHISSEQVLPEGADYTKKQEFAPTGSRYDHQISLFGKTFQSRLENLNIFMVGCGALGCENIKNFALCGISCGSSGALVVTDNDRIEVSNLSRQFLFREDNVGQPKSVAAGARMRQINPAAHIDARQDFVGPTTEHLYPDSFWSHLDVVVNALDNMEARLYVDGQCVRFHKILVEAGTMGTGGNVDIIVPGKTSSYADGGAADQTGGIPMCTLRNFPYIYDHCIEWARAQFDDLFVSPMQAAGQIIEDPKAYVHRITAEVSQAKSDGEKRSMIEKNVGPLKSLRRTLAILAKGANMEQCGQLAFDVMFKLFRDRIQDLQTCFPRDAKKKNGEPFWGGHRKYPRALTLHDVKAVIANADAANFLIAAVNLYACMFGVHPPKAEARFNDESNRYMKQYRTESWLASLLSGLTLPPYVQGNVDGLDDDAAADAAAPAEGARTVEEEQAELDSLLKEVTALAHTCSSTKAAPLEFEKDDDDNFQIDFIAAASNLRAENYAIPTADRMKVKLVAGKIIPAIATTTSAVTGLALIELFKVLQGKDISCLRNGMLDVGTNNYVLFERDTPVRNRTNIVKTYLPEQDYTYKKLVVCVPEGFTKYDMINIDITRTTTVKQVAAAIEEQLNSLQSKKAGKEPYTFEVEGLGVGKGLLWNGRPSHSNTNAPIMEAIEVQKTSEAGEALARPFWETRTRFFDLSVTVSCEDDDAECDEIDVEIPTVCLHVKA